jgi:hypothetical protein
MQTVRPAIANDPRRFGRGIPRSLAVAPPATGLSDDFKLFATTFLAGFVFVSVFLA